MTGSDDRFYVESYVQEEDAWVLETIRVSRKDAELDVDLLKMLGKKARINEP
jgi:hypothetical protein